MTKIDINLSEGAMVLERKNGKHLSLTIETKENKEKVSILLTEDELKGIIGLLKAI